MLALEHDVWFGLSFTNLNIKPVIKHRWVPWATVSTDPTAPSPP